jgi:hypothetical protein
MRTNAPKRTGKSTGDGLVALLFVVGVIAAVIYFNKKTDTPPREFTPVGNVTARSAPDHTAIPQIALGGTYQYRCLQFGATVTPDLKVTITAGVAVGLVGVTWDVIVFSGKDCSFVFVPDFNPQLSLELGKYRTLEWTAADGFGQDVGVKFPMLKGRVVYDFKMEVPKSAAASPSGTGQLAFEKGMYTFTPGLNQSTRFPPRTLLGQTPSNPEIFTFTGVLPQHLDTRPPPPHTFRFGAAGCWLPQMGYTWLDGTVGMRQCTDLAVRWNPGQPNSFPPHTHTSTIEGFWEPDLGYQWLDGSSGPCSTDTLFERTVRWTPGLPDPNHPHVIASVEEGRWVPAPGYIWATEQITDLSVRPLDTSAPW